MVLLALICIVLGGISSFTGCDRRGESSVGASSSSITSDTGQTSSEATSSSEKEESSVEGLPTITFIADGKIVGVEEYQEGETAIKAPEVPEKRGYEGRWEHYTLNGESWTVYAVYEIIEYTVTYHVVKREEGTLIVDYQGAWTTYWQDNLSRYGYPRLPTVYTVESGLIEIQAIPTKTFDLNYFTPARKLSGKFTSWFTDENCTQAFSGTIPQNSTGNLQLYAQWKDVELGPF